VNIRVIKQFLCLGEFSNAPAVVETDLGRAKSKVSGQILFAGTKTRGGIKLRIKGFNAMARSVKCKAGPTGPISLRLIQGSDRVVYKKSRDIRATFKMGMHYPLITQLHGFQRIKGREKDNFVPHVAVLRGVAVGRFARELHALVRGYKSFDRHPTTTVSLALSFDTPDYHVKGLRLELRAGIIAFLTFERSLKIQPVFIRSGPTDPAPTGWSFDTMMENARVMWRKCCINLDVQSPAYIDDATFKAVSSISDVTDLLGHVTDVSDAVEIVVTSSLGGLEAEWGGGATFDSGTASARIVTCDDQLQVFESGKSRGAINYNHLAHELGHVMGLNHPGTASVPPMVTATADTVMEPSGFYADNPHAQSQDNCANANNPLMRWELVAFSRRCRQNPEL